MASISSKSDAPKSFTDAGVKALPLPPKGSRIYFDPALPGFGARVTANGARSYIIDYRVRGSGRQRRYTIGDVANWTIGAARKKARELRRDIDDGGDPLGDLQDERAAPTVFDLIECFDAEHIAVYLRPRPAVNYRLALRKHIGPHFGQHVKVTDVQYEDIAALHAKITKTGRVHNANRVIAMCSKMFSLAVLKRWRDDNPCKGIRRNYETKRRRYLKPDELARITEALAAYPDQRVPNIIRLLLLSGARSGEVMAMRWKDIDMEKGVWSKPASATKQKQAHEVPLSAPAKELLVKIAEKQPASTTWVFPSSRNPTGHVVTLKRAWRTICKAAQIEEKLRIHDLRHSFASELVSGGASLPLIGALLGHSSPVTTARYSHLYADPLRAAVERVGATIDAVGKPVAPVKPFRRGGRRPSAV
jgi:integrase